MPHTLFLTNLTILVVDDEVAQQMFFNEFISIHNGQCKTTDSTAQALKLVENFPFDAAIIDVCLNGEGSGIDLMDQIKAIDPDLTVILVTGHDIDKFVQAIITKDAYAILTKPYDLNTLALMILQASKNTKSFRKNRYASNNLRQQIKSIRNDREKIFINTLLSLTNALEQKDNYTKNHSEMVGQLAEKICWEYTDNEIVIDDVIIAGKLHDIGKIGIRDDILFKKDKLTPEEFEEIKKHPEMSYKIIKPVDNSGKISSYVLHHHEQWNGLGYPHKLKEKGIPTGARILAVADTFNALTSNRPYREAKDKEFALQTLIDGKNIQFDADIVEILYKLIRNGRI